MIAAAPIGQRRHLACIPAMLPPSVGRNARRDPALVVTPLVERAIGILA